MIQGSSMTFLPPSGTSKSSAWINLKRSLPGSKWNSKLPYFQILGSGYLCDLPPVSSGSPRWARTSAFVWSSATGPKFPVLTKSFRETLIMIG
jgi:hypothetical protein